MKTIELTQGYVALVDDKNYARLMQGPKWCAEVRKKDDGSIYNVYATRNIVVNGKRTAQRMHRFVLGVTNPKVQVDHFDHAGLNNQEYNLRVATDVENSRNQRLHTNNSSGYKGVSWHTIGNRWRAQITVDNHQKHLGYFTDILDARDAYDAAALEYFGEFSFTNAMMEEAAQR